MADGGPARDQALLAGLPLEEDINTLFVVWAATLVVLMQVRAVPYYCFYFFSVVKEAYGTSVCETWVFRTCSTGCMSRVLARVARFRELQIRSPCNIYSRLS